MFPINTHVQNCCATFYFFCPKALILGLDCVWKPPGEPLGIVTSDAKDDGSGIKKIKTPPQVTLM